ncbi:diguanylate cyclase [Oceanicoccus sp. KOV_DT_Chl]|uniref:diguanylate cyclase n=1 Tax=Oceanicoccus sp. KOV_DT_Chl TaxID=1904639 RepID=UPI000C7B471A|nr:diguanylate cyclase [Oceanicoccus sp. KOV_DT_Chl]
MSNLFLYISRLPANSFFWLLMCTWLIGIPAQALDASNKSYNLGKELSYYIDEDQSLSIEQLTDKKSPVEFTKANQQTLLRLKPDTVVWLRLQINFSESELQENYILTALGSDYQEIRLYRPTGQASYSEYITGNRYPADQRELPAARYGFVIKPQAEPMLIYMRVTNSYNFDLAKLLLIKEDVFAKNAAIYSTINFLSYGALTGILLFSAGIGLTLKNKSYLYYSLYILCGSLSLANLDGVGFYWLWPHSPELNERSIPVFTFALIISRLATIYSFLEIKTAAPKWARLTRRWVIVLSVLFIGALFGIFDILTAHVIGLAWLISMLLGITLSLIAIKRGVFLAWPFFFVLLIPAIGTSIQIASDQGLINIGALSTLIAKFTFIFHAFLFSICIALQIKQEELSAFIAQHDDLTKLENLTLIKTRFDKAVAIAQRYQWQLLVLFIDLDKFKPVNDTFGHEVGDQLLQAVAQRIVAIARNNDLISRIGGDEFLVVQTEYHKKIDIKTTAEKIIAELSRPFIINGHTINIGASIGIAQFPDHGSTLDELMHAADKAMYKVKDSGRNNIAVFGQA